MRMPMPGDAHRVDLGMTSKIRPLTLLFGEAASAPRRGSFKARRPTGIPSSVRSAIFCVQGQLPHHNML